jgi:hypothetical protein
VTSVKVATKPPPGIGLPRISMMCRRESALGEVGVPARMWAMRFSTCSLVIHCADRAGRGAGCAAHQVATGTADLQQHRREAEQLGVAPVPGDQPQLGIDHADALRSCSRARPPAGAG